MQPAPNEFPWHNTPEFPSCNFALGHLIRNLPERLKINGRIHAETYMSAVGAIAGYAAQRTLFAEIPPVMGVNINRATTASGIHYWFGDSLNHMLVPKTGADPSRCVWSWAAGGAIAAGLPREQMPKLEEMFKHIVSSIGGANDGKSSVPARHQAHLPARDLLKAVWPVATFCFSGKMPGSDHDFGAAPIAWWSAIAARAAARPITDVKNVLPPEIALTLVMETAIYCSKVDQSDFDAK